VRAGRGCDWGYRELLVHDLPACEAAVAQAVPDLPRLLGGHSLGGQLASVRAGLAPGSASALWLVASGTPYWRAFPQGRGGGCLLPIARSTGSPAPTASCRERRIGFGGEESRGVMRDWSRTGLGGRYAAARFDVDLELALQRVELPVHAVRMPTTGWRPPLPSPPCSRRCPSPGAHRRARRPPPPASAPTTMRG
jgi:predicted alpha/beta hydrolase